MNEVTHPAANGAAYFYGEIAFLVYDSRSGSTLFSRELARNLPQVLVGPEIRLNALFSLGLDEIRKTAPEELVTRLTAVRALDNLDLPKDELCTALAADTHERSTESVLRVIIGLYARRQGREDATVFIVKKGTHLKIWRTICSSLAAVRFLHIYRDPRAVINSKLSTPRPYYPRERMAWGGAFLAAAQWREYSSQMREASGEVQVLDIAYEDLIADTQSLMKVVADFLDAAYAPDANISYPIPQAELAIHKRVTSGGIDATRAMAWQTEMASRDVLVVEFIAGSEMKRRGYRTDEQRSRWRIAIALLLGAMEAALRTAIHYPYKIWVDWRGRAS